jgi:hypothetical protein
MSVDNTINLRRLAIRQAINLTEGTLLVRVKWYRGLVICILLVAFFSILLASVQQSWFPLLGLLLFLPLTGAFLYVDGLLLNGWQKELLKRWANEQLELDIFCDVICTIRVVPEQIIQGMLFSLPTRKNLQITEGPDPLFRLGLAKTIQTINACQSDQTLLAGLGLTVGIAPLVLAVVLSSWTLLFGLLLVIPLFCLGIGAQRLRFWSWKRKVWALRKKELEGPEFVELAARLNWQPISEKKKTRILDELRKGSAT